MNIARCSWIESVMVNNVLTGLLAELPFLPGARMMIGRAKITAPTIIADITPAAGADTILEMSVIVFIQSGVCGSSPASWPRCRLSNAPQN
jgi:hypothetical protein